MLRGEITRVLGKGVPIDFRAGEFGTCKEGVAP